MQPFHLAFPVADLSSTLEFYRDVIGCGIGRTSEHWIDFDFFGHQVTAHLKPEETRAAQTNQVDGDSVPVRHFGVILEMGEWDAMVERLRGKGVKFVIEPHVRFKGEVGEQATMFLFDPSGNALEFKAFADKAMIFAT